MLSAVENGSIVTREVIQELVRIGWQRQKPLSFSLWTLAIFHLAGSGVSLAIEKCQIFYLINSKIFYIIVSKARKRGRIY
jgi:hypothetical protein